MKTVLQNFSFGDKKISIYVPDILEIQSLHEQQLVENKNSHFPYWAKVWPSAIALCEFLEKNNHFIKNKNIVELAAGLGLPSIVAAEYVSHIYCSDYLEKPLEFVQKSISRLKLANVSYGILNWNQLPENMVADVLLLSDINYEPHEFEALYKMMQHFILCNTTIILATPQRLVAKEFIEKILPWCKSKETIEIENIMISILVLSI